MVSRGVRVAAVFPRALSACECTEPVRNIGGSIIDVQGAKYKWMLCPRCHKPRPGGHQVVWSEFDERYTSQVHTSFRAAHLSVRWVVDPETGRLTTDTGQF